MYNSYMYDDERISFPRVGEIILYTVNRGDNVYRLAKTFNSQVSWIKAMNNIKDEKIIHPNQQLLIPMMYRQKPQTYQNQRQSYDLYF